MLQLIPQLVKCLSRDGTHGLPGFIRDHNVLPYQAVNTLGVQAKPAFILYAVYKEAKCLVVKAGGFLSRLPLCLCRKFLLRLCLKVVTA